MLRAVARRLVVRRALEAAFTTLPWSAAAAALLVALRAVLAGRVAIPLDDRDALVLACALVALPPLGAALVAASRARLGDVALALLVDRALDLDERLVTAVALDAAPDREDWHSRAVRALAGALPPSAPMAGGAAARAIPLRSIGWRAQAIAVAAFALAWFLPAWPRAGEKLATAKDPEVVAVASRLAEEVKEVEEKLEERAADPEASRLLKELRQATERAKLEPASPEKALEALEKLDERARKEQQERAAAAAGGLERALSSLESALAERTAQREAAGSESGDLLQQMKELAEKFGQGTTFEDREAKRMAARLRDAAEALASASPELSRKLEQLAQAIEKGDSKEAQRLAQELAQSPELQQLLGQQAGGEALAEARRLVQQAMAQLGRAPTDAETEEARRSQEKGRGQGEGEGQGEGSGDGQAPGEGRTRSGRPDVQRDWGVGTTNEAAASSPLGRGLQQDRSSTETSDWREAYEALHDSTHLDDAKSRSTRVRGQLAEGEIQAIEVRTTATGGEQATLPAVTVPPRLQRANEEALAREEVPPRYREAVRRYFTSLDRPKPPAEPATPGK